ncbi:NFYB/HAP3 family transcription factor subunit [Candidatus Woesearchaeota archaeon]|nr:NFYB/HAP3 family transcription factor subunit [Candidatus Woesearchaeota archaeon]
MSLNVNKILKQAGCSRVSKSAVVKLQELCQELLAKISVEACNNARIFGRKTVKQQDIEEAWNRVVLKQ